MLGGWTCQSDALKVELEAPLVPAGSKVFAALKTQKQKPPPGRRAPTQAERGPTNAGSANPSSTKDELLRDLWGYRCAGQTRTLVSHACRLRDKLRTGADRAWVVNMWGVGYALRHPQLGRAA